MRRSDWFPVGNAETVTLEDRTTAARTVVEIDMCSGTVKMVAGIDRHVLHEIFAVLREVAYCSATLTDTNGNMTSDGTNTYEWDAENRLIKINYPGMGNSSEFRLDALSRTVVAVETVDGAVEGTDQFVWSVVDRAELRDGLGSVKDQYYIRGVKEGINLRFYAQDLLGSIMELTDSLGTIKARYQYEPFGVATETQGPESSDFGFAGYYQCRRSGLSSTLFRFYSAKLARWINRDPILEKGGINLYQYSFNSPASIIDPSGLDSHNIPAAELARNLSIPLSALRGGCFDIVNAALKMPPGTRPDKYKTTKCFYGSEAQQQAQKYIDKECKCSGGGVVWSKRGALHDGVSLSPGTVDPRLIKDRPVDYTTFWTGGGLYNNQYVDMTGSSPGGTGDVTSLPRGVGSLFVQFWCGTCRNGN